MKRASSSKVGVSGARVDLHSSKNQGSDKLMKKVCLGFLVFTVVALFFTTGCLGKGKRQLMENPQDLVTLNESAGEKGVAVLKEESSSLYEDPFFGQGSDSGSTYRSGTGSTGGSGSGGAGTAGSGNSGGSGGSSAGGASGGAGAPGDLPPRGDEEPPAGDPPAGDPPAGDPPAGDPPAGDPPADLPPADDDDLLERTRDRIREQRQFNNNPYFRLDDLLPGDNTEPAPDDSSYDRVFLDISDILPQP